MDYLYPKAIVLLNPIEIITFTKNKFPLMPTALRFILLLFAAHWLADANTLAQRNKSESGSFTDQTFLVSNFSDQNNHLEKESLNASQLLGKNVKGFIIRLEVNTDSALVKMILPTKENVPFSSFLVVLRDHLDKHPNEVISLFLDYNFPFFYLENEFKHHGLFDRIFILGTDENWPATSKMVLDKHQLVCFTMQKNQDAPPWFFYIWDYAVEPYFSTVIDPEFMGVFSRGKPNNPLMFFSGYNLPKDTSGINIPFLNLNINENPFLISHLVNLWKITGKRPNFIVRNKYNEVIERVIYNLNSHTCVSGNITYNLQPISNVVWEGSNQSITSGHYSFPLLIGEDIYLKPVKPGFRFIPEQVSLENVKTDLVQNFIAMPLDLGYRLIAYYPFDNNVRDLGPNKNHGQNNGVSFIDDSERGIVAHFKEPAFIKLPTAEELGLHNHDFTLSAWVKIHKTPENQHDITIIGTNENIYRQGLHLMIRDLKPYFGFYANDIISNKEIRNDEWVHIVYRYTKNTGEQAIFINGRPDKLSYKHPSFMGRGTVFIGKSIQMDNYMTGFMDDLAIWDRPLGNEEIWQLYQEVTPVLHPTTTQRTAYFFYLLILPAFLFFAYALWKRFFKKEKPLAIHANKTPTTSNYVINNMSDINTIRIFGEFQEIGRAHV